MRHTAVYILLLSLLALPAMLPAQKRNGGAVKGAYPTGVEVIEGDTTYKYSIAPIYVFARPKDMRQYQRLVNNVKKVYPLAKEASEYMNTLEAELEKLETAREREAFTKSMEREIIKKYTPVLKKMTYSQGKILIKLIDRETNRTAHGILKEFRGNVAAGFWNTIAKMFKADLKATYDKDGDDALIEQIIILYEAGLL